MKLAHHIALRAMLLGVASSGLMMASVLQRNEIWNGRVITLLVIWMLGGFFGALGAWLAVTWTRKMLGHKAAQVLRAFVFLPAFIAAGSVVFYLQNGLQTGFDWNPDHSVRSVLFGSTQFMALFAYTMSHYMLPWMAPAMMLLGYALLPPLSLPPDA
jgi:hypothetical protein